MTREQMKAAMTKMQISHRSLAELGGVQEESVRAHLKGEATHRDDLIKIKSVFTKFGIKFS